MNSIRAQYRIQLEQELAHLMNRFQAQIETQLETVLDPISQRMQQQWRQDLERIRQALARLSNGQFGLCQTCGQPIDLERLEALPYAELCQRCQQHTEAQHRARK